MTNSLFHTREFRPDSHLEEVNACYNGYRENFDYTYSHQPNHQQSHDTLKHSSYPTNGIKFVDSINENSDSNSTNTNPNPNHFSALSNPNLINSESSVSRQNKKLINIYVNVNSQKINGNNSAKGSSGKRRSSISSKDSENIFEKIDSICVLNLNGPNGQREFARTEVCWNMVDPVWVRPFTLEVSPMIEERLVFEIYDIVNPNFDLDSQKLVAVAEVELDSLLRSEGKHISLDLIHPKLFSKIASLNLDYFEIDPTVSGSMHMKVTVKKIKSPARTIKQADPFFVIQRTNDDASKFISVYKSSVKEGCNNAEWSVIELNIQSLCGGDLDRPIRVCLHDYVPRRARSLIGFFDTTMRRLTEVTEFEITSLEESKRAAKFEIQVLKRTEAPRFFDFMTTRGIGIQPIIAVDFSSTYIDNIHSNRLLHVDNGHFSYQNALSEIYDSLRPISMGSNCICYAFAEFPSKKVMPFAKINRDINSVNSLIEAYRQTRENIQYPQQAALEPVIFQALQDARRVWNEEKRVSVLAIVTNGKFNDLQKAIDRMVDSQKDPLVTYIFVMNGIKPELEQKIEKHSGKVVSSEGVKADRQVCHATILLNNGAYPDHRLALRILPQIKLMVVEYLKGTTEGEVFKGRMNDPEELKEY